MLHVGEVDSPEQSDNVHIRHSKMGGNEIEIYHLENRALPINFGIPEMIRYSYYFNTICSQTITQNSLGVGMMCPHVQHHTYHQ